uniref:Uncharacterized protein n=1 Tax=Romanomermis culicivorax TaxID=13658 RepID=A0A915IGV5_ROMCU
MMAASPTTNAAMTSTSATSMPCILLCRRTPFSPIPRRQQVTPHIRTLPREACC